MRGFRANDRSSAEYVRCGFEHRHAVGRHCFLTCRFPCRSLLFKCTGSYLAARGLEIACRATGPLHWEERSCNHRNVDLIARHHGHRQLSVGIGGPIHSIFTVVRQRPCTKEDTSISSDLSPSSPTAAGCGTTYGTVDAGCSVQWRLRRLL